VRDDLTHGDVHLWVACPDRVREPALLRGYESLLSAAERTRYRSFSCDHHGHEYLTTRALVRCTLSRYRSIEPADWRFTQNAHGRPEIAPPCGLRFNVSNSPRLVVCAVACASVGIDVEPHVRAGEILDLAPTVFSRRELADLRALSGQAQRERAVSLWTLKECYVKARGIGLSIPLQDFSFAFDDAGMVHIATHSAPRDELERWQFRFLDHAAHRIAIAVEHSGSALRVRAWETRPLVAGP